VVSVTDPYSRILEFLDRELNPLNIKFIVLISILQQMKVIEFNMKNCINEFPDTLFCN
jgi:hypothetical protein